MRKRVLIIGGASYVGSNFINAYFQEHDVYYTYNSKFLNDRQLKAFQINLADESPFFSLEHEAIFDCVVFCAQANQYSQSDKDYSEILRINITGLQKSLDFCKTNKARRFIYLSSGSVYDASVNKPFEETSKISDESHYGFSKYVAEKICEHYSKFLNIEVVILRLFAVYGEAQSGKVVARLKRSIINKEPITLNNSIGMYFTPIYIRDLVKIIHCFIESKLHNNFNIFNIAGDKVYTLNEVCLMIADILGTSAFIKPSLAKPAYSVGCIKKFTKKCPDFRFTPLKKALQNICKVEDS